MPVKKGGLGNVIAASRKNAPKESRRGLKLSDIRDRPHGDTRPLTPDHVAELAESIAAVGLIQPPAVDAQGHLLAGGHRRAALELLEQDYPKRFAELFPGGLVPVRVLEFDASDNPEQAIAIEAAENEKRRDYTPGEVRELADRLVEAGYRNIEGRPKKGQKALTPALAVIIGKSKRTVKRYLASEKTGTDVTVSQWEKRAAQLERWAELTGDNAIARRAAKLAADFRGMESKQ